MAVLTVRHPNAGGMYIWTRADFGPWHGFVCFWVYWMATVIWFPSAAMFYVSAAVYTFGPRYAWLADNRWYLITASLAAIWIALGTNVAGLKIGKWTENVGAIASWTLGLTLGAVALFVWKENGSATHFRLMPEFKWDTVNFWASIAYAMTGIEVVGMMGAEIKDPARNLPRAAWISSLFTTLFYAGSTVAVLVVLQPERVSELNGLSQMSEVAGKILGTPWLTGMIAVLVLCSAIGQFGGLGSSVARMPFAAGVDHLLPEYFAKLHPRWNTPYISMAIFGAIASVLLIAIQFGDSARAAYRTIVSLMVISGFLPYIYIFGSAWKARRRISAVSGWAVTALALACSVVPTADINRVWLFETKLAAGTLGVIGSGFVFYRRSKASIRDASGP